MDKKFAKVVIDIPHPALDKPFDYIIPDEYRDNIFVGVRVEVPFGIANKLTVLCTAVCKKNPFLQIYLYNKA